MKKQKQIVTGLFWWIAKNFIYYFLLHGGQNIFISFYFLAVKVMLQHLHHNRQVKSNVTTSPS